MSMSGGSDCPFLDGEKADGNRFEYLWQDAESFKRPTKMPAPEYIEHLMTWVQGNIDNEQTFPSRIGESTWSIVSYQPPASVKQSLMIVQVSLSPSILVKQCARSSNGSTEFTPTSTAITTPSLSTLV
jgi:Mob1/phocein family